MQVAIHCLAGTHRAACVVACHFLWRHYNQGNEELPTEADEIYKRLQAVRPAVAPAYAHVLKCYEAHLKRQRNPIVETKRPTVDPETEAIFAIGNEISESFPSAFPSESDETLEPRDELQNHEPAPLQSSVYFHHLQFDSRPPVSGDVDDPEPPRSPAQLIKEDMQRQDMQRQLDCFR